MLTFDVIDSTEFAIRQDAKIRREVKRARDAKFRARRNRG